MKYPVGKAKEEGFCEWLQPTMNGIYKLACCDCGLVHDMEFRIAEKVKDLGSGMIRVKPIETELLVIYRVRRNSRSTGQMRRKR